MSRGPLGHLDTQSVFVLPDHAADAAVCPDHGEIPECRVEVRFPHADTTYLTGPDWGTYVCPECNPSERYVRGLLLAAFGAEENTATYREGSELDSLDTSKSGWEAHQVSAGENDTHSLEKFDGAVHRGRE